MQIPACLPDAIAWGPLVFLKFGQVLAMQRDLLPAAYTKKLEQLHDELPATGIDTARATVEGEPPRVFRRAPSVSQAAIGN